MDRAMHTAEAGQGRDARRAAEFKRARRHSRKVSVMKVALPLLAVLIVAGGAGATWLARSLPDELPLNAFGLENGRLVMQDPRLSGTDGQDRPYSMVAKRAIQSLTGGGGVELEAVKANIGISPTATADIVATRGLYDAGAQTLRLYEGLEVTTSDGMTIEMSGADIALEGGSMEGAGPVHIRTQEQTVEAGSLSVADGGQSLSFRNGVKMTLMPSADGAAPSLPGLPSADDVAPALPSLPSADGLVPSLPSADGER
ncbi:hypothetical protein ASG54_02240 [Aureimonas sp. Leaf460]|nr:hypothetical protein ASG62_04975 [Aureimonas sp. Leaf427]KQT81527.1 hypothetical protein ASG54_02240 [Aureimonas sp. Leaf460]